METTSMFYFRGIKGHLTAVTFPDLTLLSSCMCWGLPCWWQ